MTNYERRIKNYIETLESDNKHHNNSIRYSKKAILLNTVAINIAKRDMNRWKKLQNKSK